MIPAASLAETIVSGTNPESGLVEPWAKRKERRDPLAALKAREARARAYRDRVEAEQRAAEGGFRAEDALPSIVVRRPDPTSPAAPAALPVGVKAAARDVAARHGLAPVDVLGTRRFPNFVHARQELMWLLWDGGRRSLPAVGRLLGGKDHTTVLHGIRQHQARFAEGMAVVALAAALARQGAPRAPGGEGRP